MAYINETPVLAASTIRAYLKKKVEPVYRKFIFMAELKKRGRITFNHGAAVNEWRPRYKRRQIVAGQGFTTPHSFPATVNRMKVELPWRQYGLGASISKMDRLLNKNAPDRFFDIVRQTIEDRKSVV